MTDTERLEKLDRWMQEQGWPDEDDSSVRVRFMDQWFPMHVREWIDQLPEQPTPNTEGRQ